MRVERELAGIALTDATMRDIEAAAAAVERAAGQAELASAHIELAAIADVEVRVGGEAVALHAGTTWSASATAPTDIEVPGVLTARVVPGTPASDTQAKLDAAQQVLAAALAAGKVDDVAAARVVDQRRRELLTARDRLTRDLRGVDGRRRPSTRCGPGWPSFETANPPRPGCGTWRPMSRRARAELDAATAAHQQAIADCETHRKVAAAAAKRLGEKSTRASVLREKLTAAQAELTVARERLAQQRESATDDDLAVKAEADGEEARRATGLVADLGGELAAAHRTPSPPRSTRRCGAPMR